MGIHLPVQGTQVRSLVREISVCPGATNALAPQGWEPTRPGALEPQWLRSLHLEPVLHSREAATRDASQLPATGESPCTAMQTSATKDKLNN